MEKRLDRLEQRLGGQKPGTGEPLLMVDVCTWPLAGQDAFLAGTPKEREELIFAHTGRRPPATPSGVRRNARRLVPPAPAVSICPLRTTAARLPLPGGVAGELRVAVRLGPPLAGPQAAFAPSDHGYAAVATLKVVGIMLRTLPIRRAHRRVLGIDVIELLVGVRLTLGDQRKRDAGDGRTPQRLSSIHQPGSPPSEPAPGTGSNARC
jgi:hypothetical protein